MKQNEIIRTIKKDNKFDKSKNIKVIISVIVYFFLQYAFFTVQKAFISIRKLVSKFTTFSRFEDITIFHRVQLGIEYNLIAWTLSSGIIIALILNSSLENSRKRLIIASMILVFIFLQTMTVSGPFAIFGSFKD